MAKNALAKGRGLLAVSEKFPDFIPLDYAASLRDNLRHYNLNVDDGKLKRSWAIAYWREEGKDIRGFSSLSDGYFHTAGAIAHMVKFRGISLHANDIAYLEKKYEELKPRAPSDTEEVVQTTVHGNATCVSRKSDRDSASGHVSEFLNALDCYFSGTVFNASSYLANYPLKEAQIEQIVEAIKPLHREVQDAVRGTDPQLVEAYSHVSKSDLKKYLVHIEKVLKSCETAKVLCARKPRKAKVKTPAELAKKVKYLLTDNRISLDSENPARIVDTTEVWLFNSKTRRLQRYVAKPSMRLSLKGSTVINFDEEKSGSKIVRKPEVLTGSKALNHSQLDKMYTSIKGTVMKVTGRINTDTLIVKCF